MKQPESKISSERTSHEEIQQLRQRVRFTIQQTQRVIEMSARVLGEMRPRRKSAAAGG
jgi:hypothetical protein